MRPKFLSLLLLWAELKKLLPSPGLKKSVASLTPADSPKKARAARGSRRSAARAASARKGNPSRRRLKGPPFMIPKQVRNRWRLSIILMCGLLSWQSVTRGQISLIFVWTAVRETKGKTLEEM